jgi:hypothetical protein
VPRLVSLVGGAIALGGVVLVNTAGKTRSTSSPQACARRIVPDAQ